MEGSDFFLRHFEHSQSMHGKDGHGSHSSMKYLYKNNVLVVENGDYSSDVLDMSHLALLNHNPPLSNAKLSDPFRDAYILNVGKKPRHFNGFDEFKYKFFTTQGRLEGIVDFDSCMTTSEVLFLTESGNMYLYTLPTEDFDGDGKLSANLTLDFEEILMANNLSRASRVLWIPSNTGDFLSIHNSKIIYWSVSRLLEYCREHREETANNLRNGSTIKISASLLYKYCYTLDIAENNAVSSKNMNIFIKLVEFSPSCEFLMIYTNSSDIISVRVASLTASSPLLICSVDNANDVLCRYVDNSLREEGREGPEAGNGGNNSQVEIIFMHTVKCERVERFDTAQYIIFGVANKSRAKLGVSDILVFPLEFAFANFCESFAFNPIIYQNLMQRVKIVWKNFSSSVAFRSHFDKQASLLFLLAHSAESPSTLVCVFDAIGSVSQCESIEAVRKYVHATTANQSLQGEINASNTLQPANNSIAAISHLPLLPLLAVSKKNLPSNKIFQFGSAYFPPMNADMIKLFAIISDSQEAAITPISPAPSSPSSPLLSSTSISLSEIKAPLSQWLAKCYVESFHPEKKNSLRDNDISILPKKSPTAPSSPLLPVSVGKSANKKANVAPAPAASVPEGETSRTKGIRRVTSVLKRGEILTTANALTPTANASATNETANNIAKTSNIDSGSVRLISSPVEKKKEIVMPRESSKKSISHHSLGDASVPVSQAAVTKGSHPTNIHASNANIANAAHPLPVSASVPLPSSVRSASKSASKSAKKQETASHYSLNDAAKETANFFHNNGANVSANETANNFFIPDNASSQLVNSENAMDENYYGFSHPPFSSVHRLLPDMSSNELSGVPPTNSNIATQYKMAQLESQIEELSVRLERRCFDREESERKLETWVKTRQEETEKRLEFLMREKSEERDGRLQHWVEKRLRETANEKLEGDIEFQYSVFDILMETCEFHTKPKHNSQFLKRLETALAERKEKRGSSFANFTAHHHRLYDDASKFGSFSWDTEENLMIFKEKGSEKPRIVVVDLEGRFHKMQRFDVGYFDEICDRYSSETPILSLLPYHISLQDGVSMGRWGWETETVTALAKNLRKINEEKQSPIVRCFEKYLMQPIEKKASRSGFHLMRMCLDEKACKSLELSPLFAAISRTNTEEFATEYLTSLRQNVILPIERTMQKKKKSWEAILAYKKKGERSLMRRGTLGWDTVQDVLDYCDRVRNLEERKERGVEERREKGEENLFLMSRLIDEYLEKSASETASDSASASVVPFMRMFAECALEGEAVYLFAVSAVSNLLATHENLMAAILVSLFYNVSELSPTASRLHQKKYFVKLFSPANSQARKSSQHFNSILILTVLCRCELFSNNATLRMIAANVLIEDLFSLCSQEAANVLRDPYFLRYIKFFQYILHSLLSSPSSSSPLPEEFSSNVFKRLHTCHEMLLRAAPSSSSSFSQIESLLSRIFALPH